jgi:uncharacterized protein (DUF433 family)
VNRITVDARVRWGTPCLGDTGTSVAHVVALDRAGFTLDRILDACPELTTADVEDALEWYELFGEPGLGPQPPDPGPDHPRIAVDPDVQGGYPVIAGTRITVDAVLGLWEEGLRVEEILDEYPELVAADIEDAVSYDLRAHT